MAKRKEGTMVRYIKVFTLASLVCAGLIAVVASMATGEGEKEDFFLFSKEKSVVTGSSEGTVIFGINGGENRVECKLSAIAGTATDFEVVEVTVHPTFFLCELKPIGVVTVETKGCNFILSGRTDQAKDAAVEIECPGVIKVNNETCRVTFGPQTSNGASYINGEETVGGAKRKDVTVKMTLSKLEYQLDNVAPLGCAVLGGAGFGIDGTFTGAYTTTAYEDNGKTGEDTFAEGAAIDWLVE